jgi:pimeloyl-ACP methyl ester carboxylesterase
MKGKKLLKWAVLVFAGGLLVLAGIYFYLDARQEPLRMNREARINAPGKFVQLSQGTTHYRLLGPPEGALVVLVHGGMVSGMQAWEKNYRFLTDNGYSVLMYDLYGRGFSDRIKGEYTPDLFFGQFQELLDALDIKQPFYIAGLSLGSMVAINYTQQQPGQIKKLLLLSPAARGKMNLNPVLKVPVLSDFLLTTYWRPRTINNQMNEFYRPQDFPEYRKGLEQMVKYQGYKSSNYSTWIHTLTYNMEPQIAEIGRQGIPTMLILGAHDPYVPADEALTYQALIPDIAVKEIAEAGHIINFEQPEAVNQLMLQFFSTPAQNALSDNP